jgi:predicted PolB exonuclease-like 3'-5' exonuclease
MELSDLFAQPGAIPANIPATIGDDTPEARVASLPMEHPPRKGKGAYQMKDPVLFIDIETIPCQKPGMKDEIRATITPPGNISKKETIDKWMDENADSAAEDKWRKTSFDGTYGEIICVGFAIGSGNVITVYRDADEKTFLQNVFAAINRECSAITKICGHNVISFDLRYLYQRCVINGVMPTISLNHEARHGNGVYDTMIAWSGYDKDKRISLKNLCAALNIPVKENGLDGSKVFDYWLAGKHDEIATYCAQDVEAVREAYHYMTFQGEP